MQKYKNFLMHNKRYRSINIANFIKIIQIAQMNVGSLHVLKKYKMRKEYGVGCVEDIDRVNDANDQFEEKLKEKENEVLNKRNFEYLLSKNFLTQIIIL